MYRGSALLLFAVLVLALPGCGASSGLGQAGADTVGEAVSRGAVSAKEERRKNRLVAFAAAKAKHAKLRMQRDADVSDAIGSEYVCVLIDAYTAEVETGRDIDDFLAWSLGSMQIRPSRRSDWAPSFREVGEAAVMGEREGVLPALVRAGCSL